MEVRAAKDPTEINPLGLQGFGLVYTSTNRWSSVVEGLS